MGDGAEVPVAAGGGQEGKGWSGWEGGVQVHMLVDCDMDMWSVKRAWCAPCGHIRLGMWVRGGVCGTA
jgi:hypothetical protein